MTHLMYKLTRPEIEEYLERCDVVLLPVGATEQHGRHLAIDTDTFISHEVASRIAEKAGVLVASVVPFGFSKSHMNFKGSISLNLDTLVTVYKEVCLGLLHHGFNKIVIINGHGGNINAVNEAIRQVKEETGKNVYNIPAWCADAGFGRSVVHVIKQEGGGHACEEETSTALYLGQRVLLDKAVKWSPPESKSEFVKKYMGSYKTARMMDEISEMGNTGDPTIATVEKGRILVDTLVEEVAEFIEDLKLL
jgi:creatinine amidohydrolase